MCKEVCVVDGCRQEETIVENGKNGSKLFQGQEAATARIADRGQSVLKAVDGTSRQRYDAIAWQLKE
jgi:hypothetical protein